MVNTMENAEEVMQILDRFTRLKQKEIPKELDDYLGYVAKTGDTVFKWASLKYLFREKLLNVIKHFHDTTPRVDEIPQYPNVDPFNYESMKSSLLERLEHFNAAPFTIQRLCELLIDPRKQYSRIDKFMRALEKNILVVSTVEPGRKRTDSENGDSLDSVVNGDLSLDVNVDIEMDNEALFAMEGQNGNGAMPVAVAAVVEALNECKDKAANAVIAAENTNNSRSGDDDILPHPKKAKLELSEEKKSEEEKQELNNGNEDKPVVSTCQENPEKVEEKKVEENGKAESEQVEKQEEKMQEVKAEEVKVVEEKAVVEEKEKEVEKKVEAKVEVQEEQKIETNDKEITKEEEKTIVDSVAPTLDVPKKDVVDNKKEVVDEPQKVLTPNEEKVENEIVKEEAKIETSSPEEKIVEEKSETVEKTKATETKEQETTAKDEKMENEINDTVKAVEKETVAESKEILAEIAEKPAEEQKTEEKVEETAIVVEKEAEKIEDKPKEKEKEEEAKEKEEEAKEQTKESVENKTETVEDVKTATVAQAGPAEVTEAVEEKVDQKATEDVAGKSIVAEKTAQETALPVVAEEVEENMQMPIETDSPIAAGIEIDEMPSELVVPTIPVLSEATAAPALNLNDQPMEDLHMEESAPEEVIMAETVAEMATDAMEATVKDDIPVVGMDVDDTSQEAMDQ